MAAAARMPEATASGIVVGVESDATSIRPNEAGGFS
jgi:hypothetical protein